MCEGCKSRVFSPSAFIDAIDTNERFSKVYHVLQCFLRKD
jgi:hypothetical protein